MFSSVGYSDVATVASRRRPEKRDLLSPNRGEQQERDGHPSYPTTVQQVAVAACKKVPSSDNGIERSVRNKHSIRDILTIFSGCLEKVRTQASNLFHRCASPIQGAGLNKLKKTMSSDSNHWSFVSVIGEYTE